MVVVKYNLDCFGLVVIPPTYDFFHSWPKEDCVFLGEAFSMCDVIYIKRVSYRTN